MNACQGAISSRWDPTIGVKGGQVGLRGWGRAGVACGSMRLAPFALERYFGEHEFTVPHLLCASDCESWTIRELLDLEPGAADAFAGSTLGYTHSTGAPALREAIAARYERVTPGELVVHVGAEEAIFVLMNVLLDPGDEVIVQMPAYQSLHEVARGVGARAVPWPTDPELGWALDPDQLERRIGPRTRAVVVNLPHSPTGYLPDRDRFDRIVEVARRHELWLVGDEVYRGLEHDPEDRLPAAVDAYERGISIGVVSKAHGLAGLRIGWLAVRHRGLLDRVVEFKDYTTICAPAPSEFLAALALRHADRVVGRNRELVVANLRALDAFMDRHRDLLTWTRPRAGPVGFVGTRDGSPAQALCDRVLQAEGVLLLPGHVFGWPDHLRIGFGRRDFRAGLERLDVALGGENP